MSSCELDPFACHKQNGIIEMPLWHKDNEDRRVSEETALGRF